MSDFEAWFRQEHGWYEEPLALCSGEYAAWQASRRAALDEAETAALSASLDAIWLGGRLMDPREIGSACAAAIRALQPAKDEK